MFTLAIFLFASAPAPSKPALEFAGASLTVEIVERSNGWLPPDFILRNIGVLPVEVDSFTASPMFPVAAPWVHSRRLPPKDIERLSSGFGIYDPQNLSAQKFVVSYSVARDEVQRRLQSLAAYYTAVIRSLEAELDALYWSGPDVADIIRRMAALKDRARERMKTLRDERDAAAAEVRELYQEMQLAVDELRNGLYCSQCERPKSQIEREERISFEQHLVDVKGVPEPADEETIQKCIEGYLRKIDAARQREARAEERMRELQRDFDDAWATLAREKGARENDWQEQVEKKQQEIQGARFQWNADRDGIDRNARKTWLAKAARTPTAWKGWGRKKQLAQRVPFTAGPLNSCGAGLRWVRFSCRLPVPALHGGCRASCDGQFGYIDCCLAPRQVNAMADSSRTCPRLECASGDCVAEKTNDVCLYRDMPWPSLAYCPHPMVISPRASDAVDRRYGVDDLQSLTDELLSLLDEIAQVHHTDHEARISAEASGGELPCPHRCSHAGELEVQLARLSAVARDARERESRNSARVCVDELHGIAIAVDAVVEAERQLAMSIVQWHEPDAEQGPYVEPRPAEDKRVLLSRANAMFRRCVQNAQRAGVAVP